MGGRARGFCFSSICRTLQQPNGQRSRAGFNSLHLVPLRRASLRCSISTVPNRTQRNTTKPNASVFTKLLVKDRQEDERTVKRTYSSPRTMSRSWADRRMNRLTDGHLRDRKPLLYAEDSKRRTVDEVEVDERKRSAKEVDERTYGGLALRSGIRHTDRRTHARRNVRKFRGCVEVRHGRRACVGADECTHAHTHALFHARPQFSSS